MEALLHNIIWQYEKDIEIYGQNFASPHEGFAIMEEEIEKLWDEIKKSRHCHVKMFGHATNLGALTLKFLMSIKKFKEDSNG